MDFELQKLRIKNKRKYKETEHNQGTELQFKPKIDLHNILLKFDPKTNDISLYLVLFERQAKRVEIKKEFWVLHLIGLLPYDVVQIIAREDEEATMDYDIVKSLL